MTPLDQSYFDPVEWSERDGFVFQCKQYHCNAGSEVIIFWNSQSDTAQLFCHTVFQL